MPARIPRRSFATPFVVTLATACSSGPTPGNTPTKPPPPVDPPPAAAPSREPAPAPAPTEQPLPAAGAPAAMPGPWLVTKSGNTCRAIVKVACPEPNPGQPRHTCNPPPAHDYACPTDETITFPITVIAIGSDQCMVQHEEYHCPPNVSCNPPRPVYVPCPK